MSRIYLAWTSRRGREGGHPASLALVPSFFHSSLAGRTDGRGGADGRTEAAAFIAQCTRTARSNHQRTNYRLHFLARNPARGSKRSHRAQWRGRECHRDRSRARAYHYRRRSLSVIPWRRCCSGIFPSGACIYLSRALVIAVNTLAKVMHECLHVVPTVPVKKPFPQEIKLRLVVHAVWRIRDS